MAFDLHPEAEVIHRGVRVTLKEARFERADGGTATREVVEAADAVVVLPLLDGGSASGGSASGGSAPGGRVVLIRNRRFAVRDTLWELPAGTLEPGEDPAACAARELTEETGYVAKRLERLISFIPTPGFCTETLTAFVATGLTLDQQSLDETEQIDVEIKTLDEALRMVRDNTIRDAKTIATLLFHHTFGGGRG